MRVVEVRLFKTRFTMPSRCFFLKMEQTCWPTIRQRVILLPTHLLIQNSYSCSQNIRSLRTVRSAISSEAFSGRLGGIDGRPISLYISSNSGESCVSAASASSLTVSTDAPWAPDRQAP